MELDRNNKKKIIKTLITLALPTIAEEILSTLLQYVDTAMVGRLGKQATTAVSVTTTITWVVNSIPHAAGIAALALIAKSVGAGDKDNTRKLSKQLLILIAMCSCLAGIPSLLISFKLPALMGAEKAVRFDAGWYFFIISLPMLFRATSLILGAGIRATGDTKRPMLVNFISNMINVGLNALFIYGLGYGVIGAALGSAISYTAGGIMMFVLYRKNSLLHFEFKEFKADRKLLKQLFGTGIPVLLNSLTSCLGYVFFARMVSGMGTTIFSAHSIAVTAEQLFYIPGYGLKTATSTMVGMALGEKNGEKLKFVTGISTIITISMMVVSGIVLFFISKVLMGVFTPDRDVVSLGAEMLRLVAFSEPFFGLMIVMEGFFNGIGKNNYPFVIETISMWGIRILFTFLCVEVWKLGLREVWYCMICDNVCKAVALWIAKVRTGLKK